MTAGPTGARLSPRGSFEAWQEVVRGRYSPWTEAELRVAESFRITLLEVILRLSDQADEERRGATERLELLIAKLNHRVRDILALIRGLVAQTRFGVRTAEEVAQVLGGRLLALARAHDQLTEGQWGPALLRPPMEANPPAFAMLDVSLGDDPPSPSPNARARWACPTSSPLATARTRGSPTRTATRP